MPVDIAAILTASISDFKAKMAEADVSVKTMADSSTSSMSKLSTIGKGALLGLGAGAAVVGVASVEMGAKFQSAMEMIHTQAGATQAEVNKMSGAVLALAGATATSPMELATALYHLESAGLRGQKALTALKFAAEGAKVGHADLESVTNALNAAIASGIPGVQNMSQAMGALNAIVGAGDMKMQDLADAMSTGLLAAVKGYGLSLNDVGGALATFGDNNIRGQNAATELRMAVMAMAVPAKTAGAVLGQLGMNTKQLAEDMAHGGLNQALTDLHSHLEKAGDLGTNLGEILTSAFGKKAGVGINVLIDQFSRFQSKTEEVRKGAGNFGKDWTATTKTLSFQLDQMKAGGEALAIQVGSVLIPILSSLGKTIGNVIDFFKQHQVAIVAVGGAITAILVPALIAYLAAAIPAAAATIALVAPYLAVAAAGAALAAGIYELATHWHQVWTDIKNWTHDAVDFIKSHFEIIMAIPMIGWLLALAANWQTVWNGIQAVVSTAWSIIQPIFNFIYTAITTQLQVAITIFQTVWSVAWDAISTAIKVANTVISVVIAGITFGISAVQTVIGALETAWSAAWSGITSAVSVAWGTIQTIVGDITSAISTAQNLASTLTGGLIPGAGGGATAQSGLPGVPSSVGSGPTGHALFHTPSANGTASQAAIPATGGGAQANVQLVIDGSVIGTVLVPILQTAFLQAQRSQVSLGFQ